MLREIQTYVISEKTKKNVFRTHLKASTLDTIPQSIVREDNDTCLKFATMQKISPRTKNIRLPDYFICTKVGELEIKGIGASTHDKLADQSTKGFTAFLFVIARKALIG